MVCLRLRILLCLHSRLRFPPYSPGAQIGQCARLPYFTAGDSEVKTETDKSCGRGPRTPDPPGAALRTPAPPHFFPLSPGHQHLPVALAGKGEVRQERLHEPGRVGASGGADPVSGVQHRKQQLLRRDEVLREWHGGSHDGETSQPAQADGRRPREGPPWPFALLQGPTHFLGKWVRAQLNGPSLTRNSQEPGS